MARRTAKKKSDPTTKTSKSVDADTPKANGDALFAGFEQQCVALRTWHEKASNILESREADLDKRADDLTQEQAELADGRQQLEADLKQLAEARSSVETERKTLEEMRRDLEAEWSALRDLRDAQAKLGHELDTERQRLNRRAFKMTAATAVQTPKLKAA